MPGTQPRIFSSMDLEFHLVLDGRGHESGAAVGLLNRGGLEGESAWVHTDYQIF